MSKYKEIINQRKHILVQRKMIALLGKENFNETIKDFYTFKESDLEPQKIEQKLLSIHNADSYAKNYSLYELRVKDNLRYGKGIKGQIDTKRSFNKDLLSVEIDDANFFNNAQLRISQIMMSLLHETVHENQIYNVFNANNSNLKESEKLMQLEGYFYKHKIKLSYESLPSEMQARLISCQRFKKLIEENVILDNIESVITLLEELIVLYTGLSNTPIKELSNNNKSTDFDFTDLLKIFREAYEIVKAYDNIQIKLDFKILKNEFEEMKKQWLSLFEWTYSNFACKFLESKYLLSKINYNGAFISPEEWQEVLFDDRKILKFSSQFCYYLTDKIFSRFINERQINSLNDYESEMDK